MLERQPVVACCLPSTNAIPARTSGSRCAPSSRRHRACAMSRSQSWVAILGSKVVGAIILEQHFPASFEVHFMAVRPEHHRRGIGRALLDRLETEVLGVADDLRELPPPFVVGLQLVISLDGKRSPVETGRHGTAILASGRPR